MEHKLNYFKYCSHTSTWPFPVYFNQCHNGTVDLAITMARLSRKPLPPPKKEFLQTKLLYFDNCSILHAWYNVVLARATLMG